MNRLTLFEEYRLIERNEMAINKVWKGAHLLLFFLAFVFGTFCTFSFHMLMYLFDEKCVLFPKLLSLASMRTSVIYEILPIKNDFPVDFLSTRWVDKSMCSLPTYVPLVSGIFGLVWTTIYLMCSTGNRTLTGLQRPWRILPPVILFSLAMCGLCIYSSVITHNGLQELCIKLGDITGSSTCTYTVNVVTLAYERRIRGVYQATRLTIISAWLHTACWFCSAILAIARIMLVVDFQLVRVSVTLNADIDKLMERNESQLKAIAPDIVYINDKYGSESEKSETNDATTGTVIADGDVVELLTYRSESLYSKVLKHSTLSLVPAEMSKLARIEAYKTVPKNKRFIVDIVFNLIDNLSLPEIKSPKSPRNTSVHSEKGSEEIVRQYGTQSILTGDKFINDTGEIDEVQLIDVSEEIVDEPSIELATSSRYALDIRFEDEKTSSKGATGGLEDTNKGEEKKRRKSSLKHSDVQTTSENRKRVVISNSVDDSKEQLSSSSSTNEIDKESQTPPKEKQD